MSITETRQYDITCAREVAADCLGTSTTRWTPETVLGLAPTSVTSATQHFRDAGWRVGAEGKPSSCPPCIKAWEGEA